MKDTRSQFKCQYAKANCFKIQAEDSKFCPHHVLISSEEAGENERRMEKARRGKKRKKLMRDALETSPLRAVNPTFPKESGYSR